MSTKPFFLFLDLDNTILDFDAGERLSLSQTLREFGVGPTETILARYHQLNALCWERMEIGLYTQAEVLVMRFKLLFEELGLTRDPAAVCERYETLLHSSHQLVPGAREMLDALYGQCRMYVVSNGMGSVQDSRLSGAGIAQYFEDVFISEHIGFHKPRREFFHACFDRIPDFDRARALIVGDSLTSDILGGINAGIPTCWFNPQKKPGREEIRPDYEIASPAQLPALVEALKAQRA